MASGLPRRFCAFAALGFLTGSEANRPPVDRQSGLSGASIRLFLRQYGDRGGDQYENPDDPSAPPKFAQVPAERARRLPHDRLATDDAPSFARDFLALFFVLRIVADQVRGVVLELVLDRLVDFGLEIVRAVLLPHRREGP